MAKDWYNNLRLFKVGKGGRLPPKFPLRCQEEEEEQQQCIP